MRLTLESKVLLYPGAAGWHFITVDEENSREIRKSQDGSPRKGWGSIPVLVTLGKTQWKTSVFPNSDGTYLLPLKAEVRRKEKVAEGDMVAMELEI
jgi:hypothetical protein